MNEMDKTLEIYASEAEDLLRLAEKALVAMGSSSEPLLSVQELYRCLHTIKSSAAMVGFALTSEHANLLETLVNRVRSRKLQITKGLASFLEDSIGLIRSMVKRSCNGQSEADPADLRRQKDQVAYFLGSTEFDIPSTQTVNAPELVGSGAGGQRTFEIHLDLRPDFLRLGGDPLSMLLSLSQLGDMIQVTPDTTRIPQFDDLSPYDLHISWRVLLRTSCNREALDEVLSCLGSDSMVRIEMITDPLRDAVGGEADAWISGTAEHVPVRIGHNLVSTDSSGPQSRKDEKPTCGEDGSGWSLLKREPSCRNPMGASYRQSTVRVGVEKIEHLLALTEKMEVGFARIQGIVSRYRGAAGDELLGPLEELVEANRELRESATRIRMFPLDGTLGRLQRFVRDLAIQEGKSIAVKTSGGDTELDRDVIEVIMDPLKHLLRNCVDHGIEPSAERLARGKPATGLIEIKAWQRGGRILIEISDDGRGIDMETVRRTAYEGGWLPREHIADMEELLELVFQPGLSTRPVVTRLSGNGEGMGLAKKSLEVLGGSIVINTEKDKGTVFTIMLPRRFSLMEVLHVRVCDGHSCLLPLHAVLGTETLWPEVCRALDGEVETYRYQGESVRVVDLARALGLERNGRDNRSPVLVFVNAEQQVLGLVVDEVLESRQVVTKTLDASHRHLSGLGGVAVMADGVISVVIDLQALEERCTKRHP